MPVEIDLIYKRPLSGDWSGARSTLRDRVNCRWLLLPSQIPQWVPSAEPAWLPHPAQVGKNKFPRFIRIQKAAPPWPVKRAERANLLHSASHLLDQRKTARVAIPRARASNNRLQRGETTRPYPLIVFRARPNFHWRLLIWYHSPCRRRRRIGYSSR